MGTVSTLETPRAEAADVGAAPAPPWATELKALLSALVDLAARTVDSAGREPDLSRPLWTPEQMAAHLGIPESTVLEYARQGKVPSLRIGKHVRFEPVAMLRALTQRSEA